MARNTLLMSIADRLRLTDPLDRERRQTIRKLEARRARLVESLALPDLADVGRPWGPWGGHDGIDTPNGYAVGPTGTVADRRGGGSWPVLVTEQDLWTARGFSRLVFDTNYLAAGAIHRLADFTLGDTCTWQVSLRGAKPGPVHAAGAEPPAAVTRCQRVLDEWRELAQWGAGPAASDLSGGSPVLHDRRREAFVRGVRDGEWFLRLFDTEHLPEARWIEPEQVGSPTGDTRTQASWGILTAEHDAERVEAVYERRVADGGATGDWVDAGEIVHWKRNVDATVKRGLPDLYVAGADFESTRKLLRNMTETALTIAAIAYLRQHAPGVTADQVRTLIEAEKDYDGVRPFGGRLVNTSDRTVPTKIAQPGQVVDVSNGLQYVPPPLLQNVPGFVQVVQARLRALSRRWGMPEDLISGDASNNNYSSLLVAGGPFERAVKGEQRLFGQAERAVAYRVLAAAVRAGLLTTDEVRAVEVRVVYPGVSISDRTGEAQRAVSLVTAKLLSPQTAAAELGYDPAQESANIRAWQDEHPDPMAGPTPGLFGESVREDRTGLVKKTITNRAGDRQTVWVRPGDGGGSGSGVPPGDGGGAFAKAKEYAAKLKNSRSGRLVAFGLHKVEIAAQKIRDITVNAAKRRGHTDEQAARLARTLAVADFAGGWVAGAATAATVSPAAGKVASLAPTASAIYLAYSAVRNPKATWAAANDVVRQSSLNPRAGWRDLVAAWKGEKHEAAGQVPEWIDKLAEMLAGDDADWRQAVFLAALRDGHPADEATAIAAAADPQPVAEAKDASGHNHKGKGVGGGQFTSDDGGGDGGGGIDPKSPHERLAAYAKEKGLTAETLYKLDDDETMADLGLSDDEYWDAYERVESDMQQDEQPEPDEDNHPPAGEGWSDETYYHGSSTPIDEFKDVTGRGVSFTTDPDHAGRFGSHMHAVRLKVENPLDLSAIGPGADPDHDEATTTEQLTDMLAENGIRVKFDWSERGFTTNLLRPVLPEIIRQAKARGYDALLLPDFNDGEASETVVFNPASQVHVVRRSQVP